MEYPIDLTCVDEDGQSLLHGAARNGYHEITRLLMDDNFPEERPPEVKSLGPNLRDRYNRTPLHDASQRGYAAVASVLLEKGADPFLKDQFGRDPFTVGWQYGNHNIMAMLARYRDPIASGNDLDEMKLPMWSMARQGLTNAVATAFKTRCRDISVPEPCTENSPLHCAIEANEPNILRMLLETKKLPVDKPNHIGRTPLHFAALEGDLQASRLLIDHGADVDIKDRWLDEALVLAQSNGHLDLMLLLVQARAVLSKPKVDAKNLFFYAVEQGQTDAARILIEQHGVDRSVQNSQGLRAIQIANATENVEMIRLLKSAPTVNFNDITPENPESMKKAFVPFRSRPVQL